MDWLDLAASLDWRTGCPLRMESGWIAECGPLRCARCREEIAPAQLCFLRARCPMTGVVDAGGALARYADMLEPEAEHARCRPIECNSESPLCLTIGHGTRT